MSSKISETVLLFISLKFKKSWHALVSCDLLLSNIIVASTAVSACCKDPLRQKSTYLPPRYDNTVREKSSQNSTYLSI